METTKASIYDYPTYYDLVFGSDTAAELRFLGRCFDRFVDGPVKRLFEPACGTGRLLYRLGQKGFQVGGNDLNEKAVDYCNERLERLEIKGRVAVQDMSDFEVAKPFDVGFNTINSFRHLSTEKAAQGHLKCMAGAIRSGGIYVLGMHLTPTEGEQTDTESWSARRGQLAINTNMWPIEKDTKKRIEAYGIRFEVYRPTGNLIIDDVLRLRSYTAKQFSKFLAAAEDWSVEAFYDFGYDIRRSIEIDPTTEDVIVILKRK